MRMRFSFTLIIGLFSVSSWSLANAGECVDWRIKHPEWIFCDDFESNAPLVGNGRYFEMDDNKGDFTVVTGTGRAGSRGMRAIWQPGEVEAGNLKLGFGRNPSSYMNRGVSPNETFREIHYRMFVRMQEGWQGSPFKLSRATVISGSDWSQAMIAHLWSGDKDNLILDPVRCVDASGNVKCKGYNNFANMEWIGQAKGTTPVFSGNYGGKWFCVEAQVRLNSPGKQDGFNAFWVDGKLEAKREGVDFVRNYQTYGLNAVFFENHWNSGSPKRQERYFDNIVVSRQRIGCQDAEPVVGLDASGRRLKGAQPGETLWNGLLPDGAHRFDAVGRLRSLPAELAHSPGYGLFTVYPDKIREDE